jgi:hypothetical protein
MALAMAAMLLLTAGCGDGSDSPRSAADVGHAHIPLSALNRAVHRLQAIEAKNPGFTARYSRRVLLSALIRNEWSRQEAIARGIRLPSPHLSSDTRERIIHKRLMNAVINAQHFTATDAEVRRYYVAHRSELDQPAQRLVQVIATTTRARADKAAAALRSGQAPAAIRERYGRGAPSTGADPSGQVSITAGQNSLPRALEETIFHAPIHRISRPVKAASAWYVFVVQSVTPAVRTPLASVRERIRNDILGAEVSSYVNTFDDKLRAKYKPQTTCHVLRVLECGRQS